MIADCSAVIMFSLYMINCNSANFVHPRLLESRNGNGDLVLNIRKDLTLYLEKSAVLADNFYLDSSTTAGTHRTVLKGREIEANLYHDKKHQSSLILTRSINGIEVRGILNHEFTITPALVSERSSNGTVPHNISAIEQMSRMNDDEEQRRQSGTSLENHAENQCNSKEKKRHFPCEFTVELWLLASSEYRAAFDTCDDFLTYLATAVNAVGLRFINMTNPMIRFQLNGVTIDYDDILTKVEVCSMHYVGKWRLSKKCICGIDAEDTLNKTRFFVNASNIDADLVYLLTSKNLVRNIKKNSITILQDVLGMAYIGGVCTSLKAGVGEDKPKTYSGVSTMAHEISHLLGSLHDGEGPLQHMRGHPGGARCPRSGGYLMGNWDNTRNEYRLSECTKEQMQYNFRCLALDCIELRKQANVTNDYYPGQILDPFKYCQALHPKTTDVSPEDIDDSYNKCIVHCCSSDYYEDDDYTACDAHRMLEAMSCGENKTCRGGVCGAHNWTDIYKTRRTF
uniref:Reprolysin n=1 Tax=Rhipicephalus zambeziensis TaxID=60191 RepID=A0A224YEE0_9ACAR